MMNDRDWIKGFIERHTKESAGIPKFILDAYAPSLKEEEETICARPGSNVVPNFTITFTKLG